MFRTARRPATFILASFASLAAVAALAGCASQPCPAASTLPEPAATEPTTAAAGAATELPAPLTDAERARWKSVLDGGPPAGTTAAQLLPELEALLASPDPERRDRVAYEILAKWLMAVGPGVTPTLDDATVAALRDRLVARRTAPDVFARSFAALGLSVIAAREAKQPTWTPATLDAQITAAASYAATETDLRGYTTAATGWAHAAAHTADWLKFLARHPSLTTPQARRILDALTSLATRRHGARFSHGEDERMAAAARAVLRRGLLDDAAVDAWLRALGEPLAAGWPDPFDPTLYAAQRNARDLLVSVYIALSFDDAPPAAAALARLRAFMMS